MAETTVVAEFWATVLEIHVVPGDAVETGQELIVLESMKTEIPVPSPIAGVVARVLVAAEDTVDEGQALVVVQA